MNTPIKTSISLIAVFGLAVSAIAQSFSFEIPGGIKDPQYTNLSAYGEITFDFSAAIPNVVVELTHDSGYFTIGDSTSVLTGIAVLAPMGVSNLSFLSSTPSGWATNYPGGSNPFPQANNVGFDLSGSSYFGIGRSPGKDNTGLESPTESSILFSFAFDFQLPQGMSQADVWDAYVLSEVPQVFVRWQELYEPIQGDDTWPGSTIGWNNPVPEPSTIGAMSVLGLCGLLWARRRIRGKATRKA
jgi:hypothetical protein